MTARRTAEVHVRTFAIKDEAAKDKNKKAVVRILAGHEAICRGPDILCSGR